MNNTQLWRVLTGEPHFLHDQIHVFSNNETKSGQQVYSVIDVLYMYIANLVVYNLHIYGSCTSIKSSKYNLVQIRSRLKLVNILLIYLIGSDIQY